MRKLLTIMLAALLSVGVVSVGLAEQGAASGSHGSMSGTPHAKKQHKTKHAKKTPKSGTSGSMSN